MCGCPDGTYEEEDDLDEDVCEPVLGHNDCPTGQVSARTGGGWTGGEGCVRRE